jgi:WD40 repeat protein
VNAQHQCPFSVSPFHLQHHQPLCWRRLIHLLSSRLAGKRISASKSIRLDPTMASSSNRDLPKLTIKERLVAPMKSVGQGPNALRYTSQSPAWSADFSRDGQWLAACYGSPDPCVRMWKLSDDSKKWTLHSTLNTVHSRTIRSVAFCPLAKTYVLAAASFDASVSIWELSNGEWECTTQLEGHDHEIKAVTWNATGSLLATCGRDKS